jgi:hypothetical protein
MVKTIKNFASAEDLAWFRSEMDRYFTNNDYIEIRDETDNIFRMFGRKNWHIRDERKVVDHDDPGYLKMRELLRQSVLELPENVYIYMAYQRQHIPHAMHIDAVREDSDPTYAYSMVVPLNENINGVFKTVVWNKQLLSTEQFLAFRNSFIDNPDQFEKISDTSKEHDVGHCATGKNLADYLPLDGVYNYELGTAGMFNRTHIHASSNWYRHKLVSYKDIIILHIGG